MKTSVFIDGIANIVLVDGVVRFDLVTLANTGQKPQPAAPPQVERVSSVATTLPGFLRLFDQMQGAVNQMVAQGLLKKSPAPDSAQMPAPSVQQ